MTTYQQNGLKPVVLIFVARYLPGYKSGGPVRSISNLVASFGEEYDFYVVTKDRDSSDTAPYPGVRVDSWNQVGLAQVNYRSSGQRTVLKFRTLIASVRPSLIYVNGFFDTEFSARVLLAARAAGIGRVPILIAPRGELSDGALSISTSKKRLFRWATRLGGLHRSCLWQASTHEEADEISRVARVRRCRIRVAPNLPTLNHVPATVVPYDCSGRDGHVLRLIYISRIAPKKNLDFALEALREVEGPVSLRIFGPISDRPYWDRCRRIIAELPSNVSASYHGAIAHSEVPEQLAKADVFFMPTLGENYGHALVEALANGVPILTSDRTPWRGLEEARAGWDLPLSEPDAFHHALNGLFQLSAHDWARLRSGSIRYISNHPLSLGAVRSNRDLLQWALPDSTRA